MKPSGGSGLAVVIIVALLVWLSGFYVGRRIANVREVTKVESEVRTVTVPEESIIHEMPDMQRSGWSARRPATLGSCARNDDG